VGLTHGQVPVLQTSAFVWRDHQPRFHNRGYYLSARGAYAGFARTAKPNWVPCVAARFGAHRPRFDESAHLKRPAACTRSICFVANQLGNVNNALT
jgi:hypothetical protein